MSETPPRCKIVCTGLQSRGWLITGPTAAGAPYTAGAQVHAPQPLLPMPIVLPQLLLQPTPPPLPMLPQPPPMLPLLLPLLLAQLSIVLGVLRIHLPLLPLLPAPLPGGCPSW